MKQTVLGWGAFVASMFGSPVEWLKNAFLFHPSKTIELTPQTYGLPCEDVRFGGDKGSLLHGWYIPGRGDIVFIWFHGNGGNIQNRLAHVRALHDHVGGSHVLFDYQGYGLSHGSPSIPGIIADGQAVVRLVRERRWAKEKRLVFFGESLGCAVVLALATDVQMKTVPSVIILEAPFLSLHAMAQIVLPPLAFLVKDDLNSADRIPHLAAPLLVIHGTHDQTVPFAQGRDLYALAPSPKQFYEVQGAGHVDLYEVGQPYFQTIQDFVFGPQPGETAN